VLAIPTLGILSRSGIGSYFLPNGRMGIFPNDSRQERITKNIQFKKLQNL
jgi:hypothetical protein